MFRKMRRQRQQLSDEKAELLLKEASHGVLGVVGDNGYPYTVPVNHVYDNGKIYFHCAKSGHKLDAIKNCDKVSFCVISKSDVIPSERATDYLSVIAFGKARIITDSKEIYRISELIGDKFSSGYPEETEKEINDTIKANAMYCVEITVEHITGKCALRAVKKDTP